jgi:hypothetical protein
MRIADIAETSLPQRVVESTIFTIVVFALAKATTSFFFG